MNYLTSEQDLKYSEGIHSLYFYAPWIPFHKKMNIMIGKIEDKYKQVSFTAVDTDSFKGLCKRFNIDSIPTVLIMVNGEEKKRINGLVMTSAFRSAFADICNT